MTATASDGIQNVQTLSTWTGDNAYSGVIKGIFNDQKVDTSSYSVYLPESLDQCSTGIMVAVPSGTTAKDFMETEEGKKWVQLSEDYALGIAFLEAKDGGDWNIVGEDGRDEAAYIKSVSDNIHSKSIDLESAFDLNERSFYVVGYEDGGAAIQEFVMSYPSYISGCASIDGYAVEDSFMEEVGAEYCYPFLLDGSSETGKDENQLPNNEVPVPVWLIGSEDWKQQFLMTMMARADTSSQSRK